MLISASLLSSPLSPFPLLLFFSFFFPFPDDNRSVWVVNSEYSASGVVVAAADVYDVFNGSLLSHQTAPAASVPADASVPLGLVIPEPPGQPVYLVRLTLAAAATPAQPFFVNDYWLSSSKEDPALKPHYYADFTALERLPPIPNIALTATTLNSSATRVLAFNPSTSAVAFFLRVRLVFAGNLTDLLPVFWDDNCITLLPQEQRMLTVTYAPTNEPLTLLADLFNNNNNNNNNMDNNNN
jgi:hypothetical protein